MKILFYIHGFSGGGAERVMATMANYYYQHGYSVCVGCDTAIVPAYDLESFPLQNIQNGCYSNKPIGRLRSYRILRRLYNIRQIAKHEKPDVVISFITKMNILVLIALLGLQIPIIVCEHTNITYKSGRFYKRIRTIFYRLASAITVLTRRDYNLWKNKFKNVVYMPNPCYIVNQSKTNSERKKVILAAGRGDEWYIKGFDLLIKAWSGISAKYPKWELRIAGNIDDISISELSSMVSKGEMQSIKFLGFRSDLHSLMSTASIFVLSSRIEGLPMVLIEAMNLGCCCVAFDIATGPNEIIRHSHDGILVPAEDINSLQKWLSKLIEDSDLRNRLANNAPESMKKYSVDRIMSRWNILISKIIETH